MLKGVTLKRAGMLRELARKGHECADARGFQLDRPLPEQFKTAEGFEEALRAQRDSTALLEADGILGAIDIDGNVAGTDYRLGMAAFSDLCHFTKTPVSFVKGLAKHNEQLALDVIESQLSTALNRAGSKLLVVDSRSNRIEGIVGRETYTPLDNLDAYTYTRTAKPDAELSNGWLCGQMMRMTVIDRVNTVEPRRGDIVALGTSIENSLDGNLSFRVGSYNERLVCTNGMVRRDKGFYERIQHSGDVDLKVQKAVVQCAARSASMVPMMREATERLLLPDDIRAVRNVLRDAGRGGNSSLDKAVVRQAITESGHEGRQEDEVTLWNFVNGVTVQAHEAKTLQRRVEVEALGFDLLRQFTSVN